ncbi:hypothetical protein CVS40_3180 [Lucilia cuprina]|nr:hypothetical protein CVS40_3180 [Lucilia cuprina]
MSDILKIAGAVVLPNLGGIAASSFSVHRIWLFAPMWTTLYSGMGYASIGLEKMAVVFSGDAKVTLHSFYGSSAGFELGLESYILRTTQSQRGFNRHNCFDSNCFDLWCSILYINKVAGCIFIPYIAWLAIESSKNRR